MSCLLPDHSAFDKPPRELTRLGNTDGWNAAAYLSTPKKSIKRDCPGAPIKQPFSPERTTSRAQPPRPLKRSRRSIRHAARVVQQPERNSRKGIPIHFVDAGPLVDFNPLDFRGVRLQYLGMLLKAMCHEDAPSI